MNALYPARYRWALAFGLMLALFPLGVYVNSHTRSWVALLERLWPDLAVQFAVSVGVSYGWIALAIWMQQQSKRLLGDWYDLHTRLWPHVLMASAFMTASMLTLAVVLRFTEWLFYDAMAMPYPVTPDGHAQKATLGQFMALSLCIYVIVANRYVMKQMETTRLRAEALEKENRLSQFGALKSQVNPHFLFNSLSILSTLVKKDPRRSELFIDQLAKAYRYILELRDTDRVALRRELEFLQAYVYLLKTRFENKFSVEVQLEPDTLDRCFVAPLILQILIENAVKHNRMSEKAPLAIRIFCDDDDYLVVSNPLQPRSEDPHSTGVGLQNIINRYALLTDRPLWAGERDGAFVVRIPLMR